MDSFCGIFVLIFIFQTFGNAFGQAGGGMAIGLGMGGDFMVDTALGELPNPFVAMAAQSGQNTNPSSFSNTGSRSDYHSNVGVPILLNQHHYHIPSHSGGYNTNSFSLFGSDHNSLFPLDASQIAGIANEPTVFLPGLVGNNAFLGSSGSTPETHPSNHVDPNINYILRNEDFTALGNVGHLVRVPADTKPPRTVLHNFGIGTHNSNALGQSGIITINPNDIIGVADFNQPMTAGNTGLLNFNPGTGHVSEITALQAESSRLGSAVDMSSFLPPPFDSPSTAPETSSTSISASPSSNIGANLDTSSLSGSSPSSAASEVDFGLPPPLSVSKPQQPPASISNIPIASLQEQLNQLQNPFSNELSNPNANYNVLDANQNSPLDVAIGGVDASNKAPLSTNALPSNQILVDSPNTAPSNVGTGPNSMNQQSFESSMFDTSAVQDPFAQPDPAASSAPASVDITASNIFDMEMNFGLGSPSANTLPSSPGKIDTISSEANQLANMVRSGGSRFGAINPPVGMFSMPRTNDQLSNPQSSSPNAESVVAPTSTGNANTPASTSNDTHLNDLNSEGIYPFEGNHVAMDATLAEGTSSIIDMNKALQGHEPLHIEPTPTGTSSIGNTDMVSGSSVSGFGLGSITNVGGGVPDTTNSGGMAISNFNSLMHDFSAPADNMGLGNFPSPSALDSSQANANNLNQGNMPTVNETPTIDVGGTALGSGNFDFGRISLPQRAFVTEKPAANKAKQPLRQVRVDMSNFLPPPPFDDGVGDIGASPNSVSDINQRTDQSNQMSLTSNTNTNAVTTNQDDAMEIGQPFMANQGTPPVVSLTNSQPMQSFGQTHLGPFGPSIGQTHAGPLDPPAGQLHGGTHVPTIGQTHSAHSPPVVGSIFGTTDNVNADLIDKRFWERAGLTREPEVDFMTSFLNNAQPSRNLNRGNENIQIVPYASDSSQVGTKPNNIIIVGRNDATAANQFGVADIFTREQQLNPSEWQQFLSKATQDAASSKGPSGTAFNYQTQNLIGSSETKPLTDTMSRSNFLSPTKPPQVPVQPVTRPSNMRSSVSDFTMFSAPGMTGHKSVTIPNFAPRQSNTQTSFAVPDRSGSFGATRNTAPQQTTNNQRPLTQQTVGQNAGGLTLQGLSGSQLGVQNIQTRTQQPVGRLGESGRNIQDEMNTFSLGQSILISDGTVPEFARPGGSVQGSQSSPGMQTLGQPARPQPGGQSIFMQNNNQDMPATFPSAGGVSSMTVNRTTDFSFDANINPRPMVSDMTQLGQMIGNTMGTDASQLVSDTKQPMSPTLFTSGNRLAVFGPARDVSGRLINNNRQEKPIPATRVGVLAPVVNCRYSADPTSEYYFIYKNGLTQHRFRCALGTAFDEMTCECSIRVSDHGDCLEVHMDFNEGVVVDSSLNRLPIGNENVEVTNSTSAIPGVALFGGDGKLTIWRYQNYDFRDHVMLKVQFRRGVGGDRYQPLITNCDGNVDGPSMAIVYDNLMQQVLLMLKTDNDTKKQLAFTVNPDEWNDVTYIYDGQEFIGIVNGVRRYVSKENPHLLGIIGGVIKSAPTQGLVEIRDAAIVLGHCPQYGYFRGAMVDIQIYTCIPKDFRLE